MTAPTTRREWGLKAAALAQRDVRSHRMPRGPASILNALGHECPDDPNIYYQYIRAYEESSRAL